MFSVDIGIDLGTSSVLIYRKGKGIILNEPSVVAINRDTNKVIAVGDEAKRMIGKNPDNIEVIRPLKEGVISNYNITEIMLKFFLKKIIGRRIRKPRISVCVPTEVTSVERKAVLDAIIDVGAREVFIIEEPVAAAIGAGIDVNRACGSMIVDIGGGTTDIAVISLGGQVAKTSLRTAGDDFDYVIERHVRKKHNLLIGEKTAEDVKKAIGTAYSNGTIMEFQVRGRNAVNGLPSVATINSEELYEVLEESVNNIINAIYRVMERTPPELSADIYERGIVMTGGGALLQGLDRAISEATSINAVLAEDPIACVVVGTGKYIEHKNKFQKQEKYSNNVFFKMYEKFKLRAKPL